MEFLNVHALLLYLNRRYVIVKVVRKDHLDQLPVPNRMKKYLNTPFYYSEQVQRLAFCCEDDLILNMLGAW